MPSMVVLFLLRLVMVNRLLVSDMKGVTRLAGARPLD